MQGEAKKGALHEQQLLDKLLKSKETSVSSDQVAHASNDLARLATDLQGIVGQCRI